MGGRAVVFVFTTQSKTCVYSNLANLSSGRGAILYLTTFSDGCLGSNNDEGRSEMR